MKKLSKSEVESFVGHRVLVKMKSGESFVADFSASSIYFYGTAVLRHPIPRHPSSNDVKDYVSYPYVMIESIKAID